MVLVEEKLKTINEILMKTAPAMTDSGLLNGKMGVSIYFFYLAQQTGLPDHQNFAEKLLDEVYEEIHQHPIACGFGDGLAGIAWGIEHLIKEKFVEAEVGEVLADADDKIFQYIVSSQDFNCGFMDGLMGYLNYIISRLEFLTDNKESDFLFKRLLIDFLNRLSRQIEEKKIRLAEPPFLNFIWDLPICLILLSKVWKLHLYRNKIERIIKCLSPAVLSYFPHQQGNKLYLLFGLQHILQQCDLPQWDKHATMIKNQIDLDHLLHYELKDKNIFFSNGLAGVSLLMNNLNHPSLFSDGSINIQAEFMERIFRSNYFRSIIKNNSERPNSGLLHGLAGIGMQFLSCLNSEKSRNVTSYSRSI